MEQKKTINKKLIAIIVGIAVIVCIAVVVSVIVIGGNSGKKLAEQLELAEQYMDKLDYEAAIDAYEAAIEIDPKCEDAYLGLAEVYVAMGEYGDAIEVLEDGYEKTESRAIRRRLEEIEELLEKLEEQEASEQETDELSEDDDEIQEGIDGMEESFQDVSNEVTQTESAFVAWEEAGLEDHVMDWQDENLEVAMREITGITTGDIMLSDVWENTCLDLTERGINCIDGLEELTNLQYLYLNYNNISDISGLSKLINLRSLHLNNNCIYEIEGLNTLVHLQGLYLKNNYINDIDALEGLSNLKELDLSKNNISDVNALSVLMSLQYLALDENEISEISALNSLINLQSLYLRENNIIDISALADMANLQKLYLHGNNVSNISVLNGLNNLRYSDLLVYYGMNGYELADSIRRTVLTCVMDPEINTDEESKNFITSITGTSVDLCSMNRNENKFLEAIGDILGIAELSDLKEIVNDDNFTGHIWMQIESNKVSIELDGTDFISINGQDNSNRDEQQASEMINTVSDYELVDNIRSAVLESFMDPEIVCNDEASGYIASINGVTMDLCSFSTNDNIFWEKVGRTLGISDFSVLKDMIHDRNFNGHILLLIDGINVTVKLEGTGIISQK